MSNVKFGVTIWPLPLEQAERVEELGFDSLWTGEHMLFWVPMFDAVTVLAAFAARTRRILLGSAVLLLPLRHPTIVAKEVASLDVISGGRIILGVGVGGEFPREFGWYTRCLASSGTKIIVPLACCQPIGAAVTGSPLVG